MISTHTDSRNEIVAGHGASGLAFALMPVGVVFAFIFRKTVNDFFES